jgi:hypothetical protein
MIQKKRIRLEINFHLWPQFLTKAGTWDKASKTTDSQRDGHPDLRLDWKEKSVTQ